MNNNSSVDLSNICDDELFSISVTPSIESVNLIYKVDKYIGIVEDDSKGNSSKCWNCLSSAHSFSACKKRINQKIVAVNKLIHQSGKNRPRYHEHTSEIEVGIISPRLRQALGTSESEVPDFIINMNTFGYPLGLLKKTIKSVHFEDNFEDSGAFNDSNESNEEGEIKDTNIFDTSKFYKYPGFNCPLNSNSTNNLISGYSPKNDLKKMKAIFEEINGKRRCLREESDRILKVSSNSPQCATDIEDSVDGSVSDISFHDNHPTPDDSLPEIRTFIGTPVLSNRTKYSKIPDISKFSDGMGELVNFENPNNYTGNYIILKQTVEKFKKSGVCINN